MAFGFPCTQPYNLTIMTTLFLPDAFYSFSVPYCVDPFSTMSKVTADIFVLFFILKVMLLLFHYLVMFTVGFL